MAKAKVLDFVDQALEPFFQENGYKLWHREFQKEGKDWVLRVYAERADDTPVDTDDCESISRYLSGKLDEADPIEQNYVLEVSSPGMDRVLRTEEQFRRYLGTRVDVNLYKAVNGSKTATGTLDAYEPSADGKEGTLTCGGTVYPLEQVASVRLTIEF